MSGEGRAYSCKCNRDPLTGESHSPVCVYANRVFASAHDFILASTGDGFTHLTGDAELTLCAVAVTELPDSAEVYCPTCIDVEFILRARLAAPASAQPEVAP